VIYFTAVVSFFAKQNITFCVSRLAQKNLLELYQENTCLTNATLMRKFYPDVNFLRLAMSSASGSKTHLPAHSSQPSDLPLFFLWLTKVTHMTATCCLFGSQCAHIHIFILTSLVFSLVLKFFSAFNINVCTRKKEAMCVRPASS